VVDVSAPTVAGHAHLDIALEALTTSAEHWVTVLDAERQVLARLPFPMLSEGIDWAYWRASRSERRRRTRWH